MRLPAHLRPLGRSRLLRAGPLAAIAIAVVLSMGSPASGGAPCTNSWTNPGGGDWENSGNWSQLHPPTLTESACIELNGNYTVTVNTAVDAGALTVGTTTTSGTQTLLLGTPAQGGALNSPAGVTNGGRGVIAFDSTRHSSSVNVADDLLTNLGRITTAGAAPNEAAVFGTLINADGGVIRVSHPTGVYNAGNDPDELLNQGRIEVADGQVLIARRGMTITNDASGHIQGGGSGHVLSGAEIGNVFNEAGTTGGPAPVRIVGGMLNYTGDGASEIRASDQFNVTGALQAGQTLNIVNGLGTAASGFTNEAGAQLRIESTTTSSNLNVQDSSLLNRGTITATGAPGHEVALFGNVTNAATGVLRANHGMGLYSTGSGSTWLNNGTVEIADGHAVVLRRSTTFTHDAPGHIDAAGTGHLASGTEIGNTFNEAGTTSGSRPVVIHGGTLNYIGDGVSDIVATGQFNLSGTMHTGQSLTISEGIGNAQSAGFTNDGGQLRIEAFSSSSSLNVGTGTLENAGTIRTVGGAGFEVQLFGNLVNTGRLELAQNVGYFQGSSAPTDTLLNEGQLVVEDGGPSTSSAAPGSARMAAGPPCRARPPGSPCSTRRE